MSLATQYYVKAKDSYPYDLEEALEAMEYALSYDDSHAGVHCLLGQFHIDQEKNYKEGFYHFEQALVNDVEHIDTYYHFSIALIHYGAHERAKKLLDFALTVNGVCKSCIIQRKALIHEYKGNLCKSSKLLKKAMKHSVHNDEITFLKSELKRVKEKNGEK